MVNYFCWGQMNKFFMHASADFVRKFDKKMFYASMYGNFKATVEMDDVTMMYTMGGEMQ